VSALFSTLLGQLAITEGTTRGHNIQSVATNRAAMNHNISQSPHQQPSQLIVIDSVNKCANKYLRN